SPASRPSGCRDLDLLIKTEWLPRSRPPFLVCPSWPERQRSRGVVAEESWRLASNMALKLSRKGVYHSHMPEPRQLAGSRAARPVSGRRRAAETPPSGPRAKRGRKGLIGGLAGLVVLGLVLQIGITRARLAHLPPLLAWDGPDAASGTRETELRLSEAARRAPADARAQLDLGQFYEDDAKPFEALWA